MQTFQAHFAAERIRSRGFTRLEFLAVLAILTVGVSLIFPGLQFAREAARRNQCKKNLLQLGILMRESGRDRDDDLPSVHVMNLENTADSELRLIVKTVIAAFGTVAAALGALFIRFAVRYSNRRNIQRVHEGHDEQPTGSLLERWFCPPSSSPV